MISTIDRPLVNNTSSSSSSSSKSPSPGTPLISSRRPSYVGLSKSVSGYSTLYKYSASEDRRGPAASIPVSKDPQTLNAMRQELITHHTFATSSAVLRESSPGSDSNSSSSSNSASATNCGNLVQKQIERLYGGKLTPAALKSPPRYSNHQNSSGSSPGTGRDTTDQVELKVPAVFRLLRPEFREQLKMHSCTVEIPDERLSKKERIIPITKIQETTRKAPPRERIIPIQREDAVATPAASGKPALPAKPSSPVRVPPVSPPPVTQPDQQPPAGIVEDVATSDEDEAGHLVGGLRERELLCTIVEEDNESTASGYTAPRSNGHPRPVHHRRPSNDEGRVEPCAEEEAMDLLPKKDGHYFIKLIENEVFKFEEQICDFEEDLCNNEALMNEDVRESILAAIGKAKLLMGQKLAQFRGLCDRNINSCVESDPFVPTSDDLAGFWDMVYIQVEHIHSLFAELVEIRKNGWKKPELEVTPLNKTNGSSSSSSKSNKESRPVKKKKTPSSAKPKSNIAKARDEARRKMLEEKKKELMRKKTSEASSPINNENGVLMFI